MTDNRQTVDPVVEQIRLGFPSVDFQTFDAGVPSLVIPAEHLVAVCRYLKVTPSLDFDYLASVTAIDYLDRIDIVYQIRSLTTNQDVVLRLEVDRDESVAPSVTSVWRAADFQEREIYDLLGVIFDGHPDLRRILLPDDWEGYPLRKSYTEID